MKRLIALGSALCLATELLVGCENKAKTERKETVTDPGGSTTTTDTHKVESSGDNPPANSQGEAVK